ncbi:MAG: hypothetical protein AAF225_03040, partial [Pseudomonadota bacterium]
DVLNISVTSGSDGSGDGTGSDGNDPLLIGDNQVDFTATVCGTNFTEGTVTVGTVNITACLLDPASASTSTITVGTDSTVITGTETFAAGNLYVIDGPTFVGENTVDGMTVDCSAADTGTLIIEPGAVIAAKNDDAIVDTLVVSPCSTIEAQGTRINPIIFTTLSDLADADVQGTDLNLEEAASNGFVDETGAVSFEETTNTSRWGGIVINGLAPINDCSDGSATGGTDACIANGEGNSGLYGGSDAGDDSGTLSFVRIQYAGFPFTDDNELNGLALQGVGDGTTLEFIQIHNNADDGIEFFGGTANVRFLVVSDADDDSIDWTDGWTGSIQYAVVVGDDDGSNSNDNQIEGDNVGDDPDADPRSFPTISNFTFVGNGDASAGVGSDGGITLRAGTAAVIANGIVSGTREPGISFTQNSGDADVLPEFFSVVVAETDLENDGASPVVGVQAEDDEGNLIGSAVPASFVDDFETMTGDTTRNNVILSNINLINGLFLAGNADIDPTFGFPIDGSGDLNTNGEDDDVVTITRQTVDLTVDEEDFNPFLQVVDYVGAFDPSVQSVASSWLREWVLPVGLLSGSVQSTVGDCPAGTFQNTNRSIPSDRSESIICTLTGTLTSDVTLVAGALYELSGSVFVGDDLGAADSAGGVTLTVPAGVTIFAASDDPEVDTLIVSRGNQISINGTDTSPVIMTNLRDLEGASTPVTGNFDRWGGVVVNGRAPINACADGSATGGTIACEKFGEGNSGLFGGATTDDSSGNIEYLQIRYAGFPFTDTNELNGLALQGVGNGTTVDFVEVVDNADDGIEFFGGTVNASHIIISNAGDDSIDWTDGWQGALQFAIVVNGDQSNDNVFEGDNRSSNADVTPISVPVIANVTASNIIDAQNDGTADNSNGNDDGIVLRAGTDGLIANAIVVGVRDDATDFTDASVSPSREPELRSVFVADFDGSAADTGSGDVDIFTTGTDNVNGNPTFSGLGTESETGLPLLSTGEVTNAGSTIIGTLETFYGAVTLPSGVTAAEKAAAIEAFLDDVDYVGAFENDADNWHAGWSFLDENN